MRVLVCGDRNWTNREVIFKRLVQLPPDTVIIEGEARGADVLARDVAFELGFAVQGFPADWDKYGRSAGPIRNTQMLNQNPQLVIAFHSDIENSKGTGHTVKEAKKRGIPVEVIPEFTKPVVSCPICKAEDAINITACPAYSNLKVMQAGCSIDDVEAYRCAENEEHLFYIGSRK